MANRQRPTPREDEAHALRMQEANRFAHQACLEAQRNLRPHVEAYRRHPATGGGVAMVADIPVEGAEATRRYPGMGGPDTFGLLRSAHELGNSIMAVLREEEDLRLEAIPRSKRWQKKVVLVFGAPGSGKTTLIESLSPLPETALAIEAVGGDTGYLLRQATHYRQRGFQVVLIFVWTPLELAVRRAAHRTFWNHRGVPPVALARLYRDAVMAPAVLLPDLLKPPDETRPELRFFDNRGPLADLRLVPLMTTEDLLGRDLVLDQALQGHEPDLAALTDLAINTTIDQIGAHLDQGLPAHPDLIRTYATGHQHAHPGDGRSEDYWALWRRSLAPRGLDQGSGGCPTGDVQPTAGLGGNQSEASGLGSVAMGAEADQERVYDLFQDLAELAKAGIQQGAILASIQRKLEHGEVSRKDVLAALDEALAALAGWQSAKVLAAVRRKFT